MGNKQQKLTITERNPTFRRAVDPIYYYSRDVAAEQRTTRDVHVDQPIYSFIRDAATEQTTSRDAHADQPIYDFVRDATAEQTTSSRRDDNLDQPTNFTLHAVEEQNRSFAAPASSTLSAQSKCRIRLLV